MKHLLFAVFLPFFCAAQSISSIEKDKSNAEKFSEKAGSLIQKVYAPVGVINKCKIEVVHYTDLVDGHKVNAVNFELEVATTYSSDTKVAVLDADELDGFIASIKIIQSKVLPATAATYTEVTFKSRSGFSAGCFSKKNGWSTFMKLDKFDGKSYVFMEAADFDKLLPILQAAKAAL